MGKINNWPYFYGKSPAENGGNGISDTLSWKIWGGGGGSIPLDPEG